MSPTNIEISGIPGTWVFWVTFLDDCHNPKRRANWTCDEAYVWKFNLTKKHSLKGRTNVVNGVKLDKAQIQGCHCMGKKGKIIVKTLNCKFAVESLYCSKELKANSPYDNALFINNSFCNEFGCLNYLVRKAKKEDVIKQWKVKHGVMLH